jgi:hypothetical protein
MQKGFIFLAVFLIATSGVSIASEGNQILENSNQYNHDLIKDNDPFNNKHNTADSASDSGWRYTFTPYLHTFSIEGDLTVNGVKAGIDTDFCDFVDVLNIGLTYDFEAIKDRWIILHRTEYFEVEDDQARFKSIDKVFGPITVSADIVPEVEVGGRQLGTSLAMGYRCVDNLDKKQEGLPTALDLFTGFRYNYIDSDTTLKVSVNTGGPTVQRKVTISETEEWIHPLLAARLITKLTDKTDVILYGDIAGFDGANDLTYSASAIFNYLFSENKSLFAGYRLADMYYQNSDFEYDLRYEGPYFGLSIIF